MHLPGIASCRQANVDRTPRRPMAPSHGSRPLIRAGQDNWFQMPNIDYKVKRCAFSGSGRGFPQLSWKSQGETSSSRLQRRHSSTHWVAELDRKPPESHFPTLHPFSSRACPISILVVESSTTSSSFH